VNADWLGAPRLRTLRGRLYKLGARLVRKVISTKKSDSIELSALNPEPAAYD